MNSLKLVMPSSTRPVHRLERVLVDAADDLVEAVVDRAVAVRLVVPRGEAVLDALAVRCTAKSMIVVVPPQAAARVPVSNVSEAQVPPNGSSMWVCASMPPGMTYLPVASITRSTVPRGRAEPEPGCEHATIVSPSMSTSAAPRPVALTTVPLS